MRDLKLELSALGRKFDRITEDISKDLIKAYSISQQIFVTDIMCIYMQFMLMLF